MTKYTFIFIAFLVAVVNASCAKPYEVRAIYCVSIRTLGDKPLESSQNEELNTIIEDGLIGAGYEKGAYSPSIIQFSIENRRKSTIIVSSYLGSLGTTISFFPGADGTVFDEGLQLLKSVMLEEVDSRYLVRSCEEVSPGSTSKISF
ncbi:MAG: hypothetical protein AAGA09_09150 [Pseudomonadota bacterium]